MGGGMGCPTCATACGGMMQASVTAANDGGVVVAAAGKLVKYDAALKKVTEVNLDTDGSGMSQTMQDCPMMKMMK